MNLSEKDITVTAKGVAGTDSFCVKANLDIVQTGSSADLYHYVIDVVQRSEYDLSLYDRKGSFLSNTFLDPKIDYCF